MLGLGSSLAKGGASLLTFVKDNLKLYLDFKSNKSDTLKFPSEGSTEFNGTSDFIQIGALGDLGTDCTITAWVNRDTTSGSQYILDARGASNGGTGFAYFPTGSTTFIATTGTKYVDGVEGSTVEADGWHFIAIRGMTLNVNEDLKIGSRLNTNEFFNGKIANVGLWSRALEPEEIQSIMNKSYSQLKGVEKTSLVSWWALDTETLSDNLATSWANAAGDAEVFNTDGANIVSLVNSSGHANVTSNYFATRYRVYKVSYDYTLVSGTDPKFFTATNTSQDSNIPTSATFATYGSSWYFTADTGKNFAIWSSSTFSISVDNFSIQEVISADSHGNNTGYYSSAKSAGASFHNSATTTTSVYGGNAPILPRAVDVAKEGQADAIGNGSASFNGNQDYVDLGTDLESWVESPNKSFSVWIKNGGNTSESRVFNVGYNNDATGFAFGVDGGTTDNKPFYFLRNASGSPLKAEFGDVLNTTDWYHFAIAIDGTANEAYLYQNGILKATVTGVGEPSQGTVDTAKIGKHFDDAQAYYFDGDISQIGLWQGTLTQAQIQSVMESTSYSKIPADVKSTLGSELFPTSNSSYDVSTSVWSKDTASPPVLTYDDRSNGSASISVSDITINTSKLYKITFTVSGLSSGTADITFNSASNEEYRAEESFTNGTFTRYFTTPSSHNGGFRFRSDVGSGSSFNVSDYSLKEVTNDIVAYYPLDGNSEVKGLSFDGSGDYISTNVNSTLTDGTYTFWAKATETGRNRGAFGHGDLKQGGFHFNYDNTRPFLRFGSGIYRYWNDNSAQDDGAWHHWAVIIDSDDITSCKLYVDGVEQTVAETLNSGSADAYTTGLNIGRSDSSNVWEGSMAQFAVYSDLKDSDFISNQYNQGIGADLSSDSNLTAYYKMDNATTVIDNSSNSNNGTVTGATLISAGTTDSVGNNDGGLH